MNRMPRAEHDALLRLRAAVTGIEQTSDRAERAKRWADYLVGLARDDDLPYLASCVAETEPLLVRLQAVRPGGPGWVSAFQRRLRPLQRKQILDVDPEAELDLAELLRAHGMSDLPGGLRAPEGYAITADGVWMRARERRSAERCTSRPLLVVGVFDDEGGHRHLELAFDTGNGWRRNLVARATVASARELVGLASCGAPVDSQCAARVVEYLSASEMALLEVARPASASTVLGWQFSGFLWGSQPLRCTTRLLADTGCAQHAEHFRAAGSLASWRREVWDRAAPYPRIVLAVYAALAPVLLGILPEAGGFVVDWSGRSSGGKTTCLRVAASVWGDQRLWVSWDATSIGVETLASFSRHLPLMLDDTQRAKRPEDVTNAIYDVCGFRGRTRASLTGLRRSAELRTVLLSTGERSAVSFSEHIGARARTLSLRGFPFGGEGPAERRAADELATAVEEHFGHVGPACVAWLDERRREWPKLAARWKALRDEAAERLPGGIGGRAGQHLAMLRLAAEIAFRACDLPVHAQALAAADQAAADSTQDADRALAALREAMDFLASRPGEVYTGGDRCSRLIGRRVNDEPPAFIEAPLWEHLGRLSFEKDAIRPEWVRRGWVHKGEAERYRTKVRVGGPEGTREWMLQLTEAAVEAADRGGA